MNESIVNVSDATFAAEVEQADSPVFVDFWAPWCGPCRVLEPLFNEIAQLYRDRIKFAKVNYDENRALVERFKVTSIPALLLLKDGEVIANVSGVRSKSAITNLLDSNVRGAALTVAPLPLKSWRAFYGDAALKQSTVARVSAHIDADHIRAIGSIPPICDLEQGRYSLIGAALHGVDLERYEGTFGIPSGVAILEEFVHSFTTQEATDTQGNTYYSLRWPTRDYPVGWLEAIPLGADLRRVAPRFLQSMLLELIDTPLPLGEIVADSIKAAIRGVATLHGRLSEGESPSAEEWKTVRTVAGKAVPLYKDDAASWGVASCAEALAWPSEELGDAMHVALSHVFFGLRAAAIRQGYSAEQWSAREAVIEAAKKKGESQRGADKALLEATDQFKALQAMRQANKPIDGAQLLKLKLELGDRWHHTLMTSLSAAVLPGVV